MELLIAQRLGYVSNEKYSGVKVQLDDISRMIMGLSNHLKRKMA